MEEIERCNSNPTPFGGWILCPHNNSLFDEKLGLFEVHSDVVQ